MNLHELCSEYFTRILITKSLIKLELMTIQSIKDKFRKRLSDLYTIDEIDTIFYIIAEKLLRKDKSIIRAGLHENWPEVRQTEKYFVLKCIFPW